MSLNLTSNFYDNISIFLKEEEKVFDTNLANHINDLYKKDDNGNFYPIGSDKWFYFIDLADKGFKLVSEESLSVKILQIAIAKHPLLTNNIAKRLLCSKNLYDDTLIELLKRDDLTPEIYDIAYGKIHGISIQNTLVGETSSKSPFCNYITDKILSKTLNHIQLSNFAYPLYGNLIFRFTDNKNAILQFLNKYEEIPEKVLTYIASNKNIPDTVRNLAFDKGCVWEDIPETSLTYHMASEMYPSLVPVVFEETKKDMREFSNAQSIFDFSQKAMMHFMENGMLSYNQKTDFVNRIKKEDVLYSTDAGELFSAMLMQDMEMGFFQETAKYLIDPYCRLSDRNNYIDIMLSNKTFHSTSVFNDFMKDLCSNIFEKGDTNEDNVARMNIILYGARLNNKIAEIIASESSKFLEAFPLSKCYENEESINLNEIFSDFIINLIRSPHTDVSIIKKIKTPKSHMQIIETTRNIAIASHNQPESKENDVVFKVFCTIASDYMQEQFVVYNMEEADYDLILKVLNDAKLLKTEHPVKNVREINKIIGYIKTLQKKQVQYNAEYKQNEIKSKIKELCKKELLVDFYINLQDFEKEYAKYF